MTDLIIGEQLAAPGAPASLNASKFNRHTFWCGQSGSRKTYALGVVLEQLLLKTELPILIMDPNADFVRLAETRPTAAQADLDVWAKLDIRTFRSGRTAGDQLHVRWLDLSPASQAAVLQMDPILDAEEYNVLLHLDLRAEPFDAENHIRKLRASGVPAEAKLANRTENLQTLEWDLGSLGTTSVATPSMNVRAPQCSTWAASTIRPSRRWRRSPCSSTSGPTVRNAVRS